MGVKVISKIKKIIREELDSIDSHELLMSFVTPWRVMERIWTMGYRWVQKCYVLKIRKDNDYLFKPTNEETITRYFKIKQQLL